MDTFLLEGVDHLILVCWFPQVSFINLVERVVAILNIGLVVLSLLLKAGLSSWLSNILKDSNNMAQIDQDI